MRQTLSISLPFDLKRFVEKSVRGGSYSTTSEFFRDLLREKKLEEDRILKELQASEREIRQGKFKILKSLKQLR